MLDVSDIVDALAETAVTRRRYAAGTLATTGLYTPGASADTTVQACLSTPNARTLEMLPEGLRSRARWLMHTTADVRTADSGLLPDKILVSGTAHEPVELRNYSQHGAYRRLVLVEDV